jgi:hypothetical protein
MKRQFNTFIAIAFFICCSNIVKAQPDSLLLKKVTISGVSLCQTTLEDLRRACSDLHEVQVEEMNSSDGQYINGKGFSSKKYPGMIFQSDREGIFVSKIRLTKEFEGNLPDGTQIKVNDLLVKDVLKIYPGLSEKWGTSDASDYWAISNDTLAFYVKIDSSKPRYPLDEPFYLERPIEGIDLVLWCYTVYQDPNAPKLDLKIDPILYMDSVNVTRYDLEDVSPDDIASVTVYKDSNAIKLVGPDGKYGVVFIHTKKFVREKYWKYFSSKSNEYHEAVPTPASDSSVAYIINDTVVKDEIENTLASINDTTFKSLKVVTDKKTMKELGIKNKRAAVVIATKP